MNYCNPKTFRFVVGLFDQVVLYIALNIVRRPLPDAYPHESPCFNTQIFYSEVRPISIVQLIGRGTVFVQFSTLLSSPSIYSSNDNHKFTCRKWTILERAICVVRLPLATIACLRVCVCACV